MNLLWWLWIIEEMEKDTDDEIYIPMAYEKTKWDLFCERHPVIDTLWPWAAGVALWGFIFGAGYLLSRLSV